MGFLLENAWFDLVRFRLRCLFRRGSYVIIVGQKLIDLLYHINDWLSFNLINRDLNGRPAILIFEEIINFNLQGVKDIFVHNVLRSGRLIAGHLRLGRLRLVHSMLGHRRIVLVQDYLLRLVHLRVGHLLLII